MRRLLKHGLGGLGGRQPATGATVLIYHRIGGGTTDERDLSLADFEAQLAVLARHRVVALDTALDELAAGDASPKVVLTFDDGFADVHDAAFPLLAERGLPFTLYLATAYVGGTMHWEGSTASAPGPALSWTQVERLVASGLCTLANHTHHHVPPDALTVDELDRCNALIRERTGVSPQHFAYPWGVAVPRAEPWLRERFRSAATGELGRVRSDSDLLRLPRVPVRRSDPPGFFAAKLHGRLWPERTYAGAVAAAKQVRRG